MSDHDSEASSGAAAPEERLPLPLRPVAWLAEFAVGAALVVLMLVTVTDALMRSLLDRPILGGGDVIQVTLVVVVACALLLCIAAGRAIAIDVLVRALPPALARTLHRAVAGLCAAALLYLAWRCFLNGREAEMFGETTMLLQIPFGPFYWVLAASLALSALLFLVEFWRGRKLA